MEDEIEYSIEINIISIIKDGGKNAYSRNKKRNIGFKFFR